jgi:hypothetical protein
MDSALVLLPQVTLADLLAEVVDLDMPDFIAKTRPLLRHVPDVETDAATVIVRGLLEVPLAGHATSFNDLLRPYEHVGVGRPWRQIAARLRIRGGGPMSSLAHAEAIGTSAYDTWIEGDVLHVGLVPILRGRDALLRPRSRTLGLRLRRQPGSSKAAVIPTSRESPAPQQDLVDLADAVAERIAPTIGGGAFLCHPGAAIAVLAATVAAVLSHTSSQRTFGNLRVTRADIYERTFEALKLERYFAVARQILEVDHPRHIAIAGPWPPGEGAEVEDLAILRYQGDYLVLMKHAILRSLPNPG